MTKILVIDTEEQARNIFLKCLEEEGFDAMAVENGLVGIQQAQEYLPDFNIQTSSLTYPYAIQYQFPAPIPASSHLVNLPSETNSL